MNMNLPMDTNKDRYEKPVQTPDWGAEMANPNSITVAQKGMTTAAEVGWNLSDMTEPSRCQETAVAAEEARTGATTNYLVWSSKCNKSNTTGRKLASKGDEYMEPIPDQAWPEVSEKAPADGTRVMQYQWNDRESVGMNEMLIPRNYLEIPEPRIPGVFLELAEEARNIILVDNRSCDTKDVHPQRTGLARPVFVTEMIDSPPVFKSRALRVTNTSTEMIPNINLSGRGEPVNRSGPVGPQNNTEQPDKRGTAPTGPVGPQSHTEQPVLLGFNTDKRGNASNGPVGHDVMLAGRGEMVEGPDLVGPHSSTEQSVFLRLDVDQVEHVPANIVHPGVKMFRNQPVARLAPMGCMQYMTQTGRRLVARWAGSLI